MQRPCELTRARWESMRRRNRKRVASRLTVMMVTVAMLAWAVSASAQRNPYSDDYWGSYDYYEQRRRTQEYSDRQDQILRDALEPWGNVEESDEYQSWDRLRSLEACNAITNNPAMQSRCLQGLQ